MKIKIVILAVAMGWIAASVASGDQPARNFFRFFGRGIGDGYHKQSPQWAPAIRYPGTMSNQGWHPQTTFGSFILLDNSSAPAAVIHDPLLNGPVLNEPIVNTGAFSSQGVPYADPKSNPNVPPQQAPARSQETLPPPKSKDEK